MLLHGSDQADVSAANSISPVVFFHLLCFSFCISERCGSAARTAPIEGVRFAKLLRSTNDDSRFTFCFSKMDLAIAKRATEEARGVGCSDLWLGSPTDLGEWLLPNFHVQNQRREFSQHLFPMRLTAHLGH